MADPNDPWAAFSPQAAPSAPAFGGRPVIQQQMTPQDHAQLTRTNQEIATQPLQNENTRVNIEQGHTSIQNQRFNQNQGLRQEFNNLPEVKNYSVALTSLGTAFKAPDTPQGDLAVIYAYAKAADPGSVVREGEMDMANATASIPQQYQADVQRLTQGKRLPPAVRTGLIETMRQSVLGMRQTYDQQRNRYAALAQQNGFDPKEIVGDPLYKALGPSEEAYVTAHGGTPKIDGIPVHNGVPIYSAAPTTHAFADETPPSDPRGQPMSSPQDHAMRAWLAANPHANAEQFTAFMKSLGLPGINNPQEVLDAAKKGTPIGEAKYQAPDITDVRGDNPVAAPDAFLRGAADTMSFGLADKVAALGDTVTRGGTYADNAARQYAISDYDAQHHFPSRFAGQVAGGAAIPVGEMSSVPQVAAKSAAIGGAYGAGSSRSMSDVPMNALTGAVAGGVTGGAVAGAGKGINALLRAHTTDVPPLVDPQTGALNQPLEAMSPGQRVVHAEEYGINLPADAAGGRSAAIIGKGMDLMPGSAGVMEDARRATESQVAAASDVVASRFGQSRTMNEAGAELQRGANERITRGKDVISKAYQAIPIPDQAPTTLTNTTNTLQELTSRFQSNPELAGILRDGKMAGYLDALQKGGLSWRDLKDFRSAIGEKIGEMRFGEGHSTSDLRALYAGLSEDMRNTASAQGPQALRAFERANTLNRQNENVIQGALTRILGKDGNLAPEKAAAAVQAMTKGGKSTGDLKTLAQIRAATIKSGAWNEIASTLVRLGGQPANSAGRDFSPTTFVNWYADMAEPARKMLFGNSDLRTALDGFVAVNQRLQKVNALRNTSNTAGSMTAAGTVGVMGASLMNPMLGVKMAGVMATNFAMAKAWTNPAFVRLITGYTKAVAAGNQNAVRSQIGRLAKLATTNPDLREPLIALQQRLANDNFARSAAASQPDQGNSSENNR